MGDGLVAVTSTWRTAAGHPIGGLSWVWGAWAPGGLGALKIGAVLIGSVAGLI